MCQRIAFMMRHLLSIRSRGPRSIFGDRVKFSLLRFIEAIHGRSVKLFRKAAFLITFAIFLGLFMPLNNGVAVETIPLEVSFSKVYKPDLATPKTCSTGSLSISRKDKVPFASGEKFTVTLYAYYPEDKKRSTMPVTYAWPEIGKNLVTGKYEKSIAAQYELCLDAWQKDYFRPNFNALYVDIQYTMNYGSAKAGSFAATIPILPKDAEASAVEKLMSDCDFSSFEDGPVIEVNPMKLKSGTNVTISGTYFISGVPAPNQPITLTQEVLSKNDSMRKIALGSTVTKFDGSFSFKFKFNSYNDLMAFFHISRDTRTVPIGFLHPPFKSIYDGFSFWCEKGSCEFTPGGHYTDVIPEFSPSCLASFKEYDDFFGIASGVGVNFADDKNRIAWLGRKVFPGSKYKVSYTAHWISKDDAPEMRDSRKSSTASASGSGGRCYVSGYTTKSGKRVSGYFRRC